MRDVMDEEAETATSVLPRGDCIKLFAVSGDKKFVIKGVKCHKWMMGGCEVANLVGWQADF